METLLPTPTHLKDLDPLLDVPEVEGVLEVSRGVLADLGDLHHLAELLGVARDEVQERQLVKVLRPLVAHLHDLRPKWFMSEDLCRFD